MENQNIPKNEVERNLEDFEYEEGEQVLDEEVGRARSRSPIPRRGDPIPSHLDMTPREIRRELRNGGFKGEDIADYMAKIAGEVAAATIGAMQVAQSPRTFNFHDNSGAHWTVYNYAPTPAGGRANGNENATPTNTSATVATDGVPSTTGIPSGTVNPPATGAIVPPGNRSVKKAQN